MPASFQIRRIHTYDDPRFSATVLYQHGAFLVNERDPFEVEIIAPRTAVVRGTPASYIREVIRLFREYAEQVTTFLDERGALLCEFEPLPFFPLEIEKIQPSQFYVDRQKKEAVGHFVRGEEDIVIPVHPWGESFVALDGHTRLSVAADLGLTCVRAFITELPDYIPDFVRAARERGIRKVRDLRVLESLEYERKWHQYCDAYWAEKEAKEKAAEE